MAPALHSGDTSLDALRVQMEVFRRIGPAARLAQALELSEAVRRASEAGIRMRHPDAPDDEVRREAIRMALGPELFAEAFGERLGRRP